MFCSCLFKCLFLCDLRDSGILFADSQSLQQRMFLLERASQLNSPCWAGSRASQPEPYPEFPWLEPTCNFLPHSLGCVMIRGSVPVK
jgi:hypothetical protein